MTDIGGIISVAIQNAWIIILALLTIEISVVVSINKTFFDTIVPRDAYVGEESEKHRTHALTFSGMAFTVIAILVALSENPAQYSYALQVLAVAIALLFFAYEVSEVVETTRYWFMLQEKALGYGFLSLFIAVIILYSDAVQGVSGVPLLIGFVVVSLVRFSTVYRQIGILKRRKKEQSEQESEGAEPSETEETTATDV